MMESKIVKELTPELADKIWNSVQQEIHEDRVSKKKVLHHLKQLKAQMCKERFNDDPDDDTYGYGMEEAMRMIDKKIEKINKL